LGGLTWTSPRALLLPPRALARGEQECGCHCVGLGRRLTRQEEIPDTDLQCAKGGGYELGVTVFDQQGNQVAARKVALGGGAKRNIPD
jgi:hypothetical protein